MEKSGIVLKKQWFLTSRPGKIENHYNFDAKKVIGSGTFGNVIKASLKGTNQKRAIKIIAKSKVKNQTRFKTEIEIMKKLDHPNVIKLYETFEDARNVYIVMEICFGGELFDKILEKGHFTEMEARNIFRDIMHALNCCHKNKICHRDLKPENFLFLNTNDDSPIKIIDFGLSTIFEDTGNPTSQKVSMSTKAGTPYYISPEVLQGDYDEGCDIWSAGVILYIMLSGVPPFCGNTDAEILDAVKKGEFNFDIPEFDGVTDNAKDLISCMLKKPKYRISASEALNHPWMVEDIDNKGLKLNINCLRNFQSHQKFKKVALTYIASQLSEDEITGLGKLFKKIDKNSDGVLTIEEIREALNDTKENTQTLQNIINGIDTEGTGTINYTEFIAATMEKTLYMKEEKLFMAFKMFDTDGSGKISQDELKELLGKQDAFQNMDKSFWEQMIKEVDKNGDGEIDYSEFIEMMGRMK